MNTPARTTTFRFAILSAAVGLILVGMGLYFDNEPTLYAGLAVAGTATGVAGLARPKQ